MGADRNSSLPREVVQAENGSLDSRKRLVAETATWDSHQTAYLGSLGIPSWTREESGPRHPLGFPSLPLSLSSLHLAERQLQREHAPKSSDRSDKE